MSYPQEGTTADEDKSQEIYMHRSNSWRLILIITLLSTAAFAQTGSIAGSVTDPTGAVLQNVQITAR